MAPAWPARWAWTWPTPPNDSLAAALFPGAAAYYTQWPMPSGNLGFSPSMNPKSVAIVIHDGVQALDVAGPLDVFAEANAALGPGRGYAIHVIGVERRPMRASNGLTMVPDLDFVGAQRPFALVLVAGGPAMPHNPADPALSDWLNRWGCRGERYGSICTGAFALGAAGLLDGRSVTTHWKNAGRLADAFPAARVEQDRIYLRDGPLVTSAGVTAGIDLALGLVADDHGGAVALACARQLVVVAQRQGGQSQFSPLLTPPVPPGSPLARLNEFVQHNLRQPLDAGRLARAAGVSPRSLARLFAADMATTPHDFVQTVRLDHARGLLEGTDLALKQVAWECGFGSAEQMRTVFQRRLGTSPLSYRASFRATETTR
jgi:transcriptional regulator GlxA family with amidase domain